MIERAAFLAVFSMSMLAIADDREPDDLPDPPPEIVRDPAPVALPAIPAFDRPAATAQAGAAASDPEASAAPAMRPVVGAQVRNASVAMLNVCNRAIAAGRYEDAITACRAATAVWDGNHLAWYGWTSAHLARREWQAAQVAIAHAVALRPDLAMYQMYDGIARYEVANEVAPEPSPPALDAARDALLRAIRREPGLWRAHYYLGRIQRDRGDARSAAAEFTAAIAAHPARRESYVALCELYRSRGRLDAALAVALRGIERVRPGDAADLWFEAGMVYEAQAQDDPAIAAFGKVLATRPRDGNARLQRAQIHARRGDFAAARLDLEDVIASTEPGLVAARSIALQLLPQLAEQERRADRARRGDSTAQRLVIRPPRQP